MFSLWAMVRHVRQWFFHSVAVEFVVNGALRTLWVNIPHGVRFMDVRFKTAPKGMLAFRRVRKRAVLKNISSRVRQHAALTDINGSLAEINVESPACGARSKTTIVRKPQWNKLLFYRYYMLYH